MIKSARIFPGFKNFWNRWARSGNLKGILGKALSSPFILVFLLPFYFYSAVAYQYPIGYAGLYSLMADLLAQNHFLLPGQVPYYAGGQMPFAYPPLGFYVMGFAENVLRIPLFTYLRFAPPLFTFLALIPAYFFLRAFTKSGLQANITVFLFALSQVIFVFDVQASGAVRGLAYLWTLWGLYFSWKAFGSHKKRDIGLAALFTALSVLTHQGFALFLALTIAFFAAWNYKKKGSIAIGVAILFLAVVFSSPWWVLVLQRYSLTVFIHAFLSHGNMNFLSTIRNWNLINLVVPLYAVFQGMLVLFFLFVYGMIFAIRRKFFMPLAWFGVIYLLTVENERLLVILAALIAAEFLIRSIDLFKAKHAVLTILVIVTAIIVNAISPVEIIIATKPDVSSSIIEMGDWFQSPQATRGSYIILTSNGNIAEWTPYFIQESSLIGPWGTEWLGTYDQALSDYFAMVSCTENGSWDCVSRLLAAENLHPDYVILSKSEAGYPNFRAALSGSGAWSPVYSNQDFDVYTQG